LGLDASDWRLHFNSHAECGCELDDHFHSNELNAQTSLAIFAALG
jgi:hypothetical protein